MNRRPEIRMACIGLACFIAGTATGLQNARESCHPLLAESTVRKVYVLDPKTEIPYEMRDRTDADYFHGSRIVRSQRPSEKFSDLWAEARQSNAACHQVATVVPEFGLRLRVGEDDKDFLLCVAACETPYLVEVGGLAAWPLAVSTARSLEDELTQTNE